jgi:hypothetical protein
VSPTEVASLRRFGTGRETGFSLKSLGLGWVWWCTPVIPASRRLRQKGHEFEVSPGYIERPCLKQTNKTRASPCGQGGATVPIRARDLLMVPNIVPWPQRQWLPDVPQHGPHPKLVQNPQENVRFVGFQGATHRRLCPYPSTWIWWLGATSFVLHNPSPISTLKGRSATKMPKVVSHKPSRMRTQRQN